MRVRNPVSRPAMTRIKGFVAARLKLAFTKRAFFASALLIHWTRIYRNGMGGPITGVWTGPAAPELHVLRLPLKTSKASTRNPRAIKRTWP